MSKETVRYTAKLCGVEAVQFHFDKLRTNPAFSYTETKQEQKPVVQIFGPQKAKTSESLPDIRAQLSNRAKQLGIDFPDLVKSTREK